MSCLYLYLDMYCIVMHTVKQSVSTFNNNDALINTSVFGYSLRSVPLFDILSLYNQTVDGFLYMF